MFERMTQANFNFDLKNIHLGFQPQKITPALLKLDLRQIELQAKPNTTLEEDLELQLLKDPAAREYAQRIVALEFNENKSILEQKELDLLKDPKTRPYAKRMVELDAIKNKTYLQRLEADLLTNPDFRPFYADFLLYTQKFLTLTLNTAEEARACFLILNPYSMSRAHEILALESLSSLDINQAKTLYKNYLIRIAEVPENSVKHLNEHTYLENVSLKSGKLIERHDDFPSKAIARYYSIDEAMTKAAQRLTDIYFRRLVSSQLRNSFFNSPNVSMNSAEQVMKQDELGKRILASVNIQNQMKQTQDLLSLGFAKIFFDFDTGFSEKTLNLLVSHLSEEISKNSFNMSLKKFPEFFSALQGSLNKIDVPDDTPAPAPRYYFP